MDVKAVPKVKTNIQRDLVTEKERKLSGQFLNRPPRILPKLKIRPFPDLIINEKRGNLGIEKEINFLGKAEREPIKEVSQNKLNTPINLEKLESSNILWDSPFVNTEQSHNQSFDGGIMKRKERISSKNERYNRRKTMTAIPDDFFLPPFKTRQVKIKEFYTMFYVKYISNIYFYRKLMPSWPH